MLHNYIIQNKGCFNTNLLLEIDKNVFVVTDCGLTIPNESTASVTITGESSKTKEYKVGTYTIENANSRVSLCDYSHEQR